MSYDFWAYMERVTEMGLRAANRPDGWFDIPSWVYTKALDIAGMTDTGLRHGKRGTLCGYPVRVDVFMDDDAVRLVTPAGGPH